MRELKLQSICGEATNSGFIIETIFSSSQDNYPFPIAAKTAFYDKPSFQEITEQKMKEKKMWPKILLGGLGASMLTIGICVFNSFLFLFHSLHSAIAVSILLFALFYSIFLSFSVVISVIGLYTISGWQAVKEWHGAEHKTIRLLQKHFEEGAELNLENLKAMKRFDSKCGTTLNSASISRYVFFCAALLAAPFVYYSVLAVLLALFIFPRPIALFISYILQSFVTTAEPSEEKLIEALETAQKITTRAQLINEHFAQL